MSFSSVCAFKLGVNNCKLQIVLLNWLKMKMIIFKKKYNFQEKMKKNIMK